MKHSHLATLAVVACALSSASVMHGQTVGSTNKNGPPLIELPSLDRVFSFSKPGRAGMIHSVTVRTRAINIPTFVTIAGPDFSLLDEAGLPNGCAHASENSSACEAPGQVKKMAAVVDPGPSGVEHVELDDYFGFNNGSSAGSNSTSQFASLETALDVNTPITDPTIGQISALETVPEPATMAMMSTGLLALGGVVYRRRRV